MTKKNGKLPASDTIIIFPNPVFGNLVISRQNALEYKLHTCHVNDVTEAFLKARQPESKKKDNREIVRKLEKIAQTVQKNEQRKANLKSAKERKALEKHSIECFNSNFNAILCEIIRAKTEERLVKKADERLSDGSELFEIDLDERFDGHAEDTTDTDGLYDDASSGSTRRGEATPRTPSSTQSFAWNYETVEFDSGQAKHHRKVSELVDKLLYEIYGGNESNVLLGRRGSEFTRSSRTSGNDTDSSGNVFRQNYENRRGVLASKSNNELWVLLGSLKSDIHQEGNRLIRQLKRREALIARQEADSNMVTALLQAHSEKRSEDTKMKFSVSPSPGDSGFEQWHSAMKMVARLSGGIPQEFRKTLWLTLAEKHLVSRGVDWVQAEKLCFNEWSNPDDEELGVQIVKDLHRTGCSLFCGASGQQNQAVLKRVLLGYARWNKVVGYCQGFNMLAALILQVMDRNEVESVKVMIYLIEGVLPESYFANSLQGLSVDMAVFRDLLRVKLPALSRHLEQLQNDSKDSGTSYEPPLTNVFTMQWFLTLFSNCLPQATVLRVWDLIFLEGNAILLQTALAIWNSLSDRIMMVESADEFYSIMGVLTREMLEFGTIDANNLIKDITTISFPELTEMRERYLYNITPWTQVARKGLRLFYAEDEVEDTDEEEDKVANIATAYGFFKSRKSDSSLSRPMSPSKASSYSNLSEDREKIALDISALKKQYCKLRERQRQAHIIFNAAYEGVVNLGQTASTPAANSAPTVNHLLQGKNAILSMKGKRPGPPPGSIPPSLRPRKQDWTKDSGETIHWKDEPKVKNRRSVVQSYSSDTILSEVSNTTQDSLSATSSRRGSIDSSSSSSTELCDEEPERLSDFDSDACLNDPVDSDALDKLNQRESEVLFSPMEPADKMTEVSEVFSPESIDNALCVDNSQVSASSTESVSPIELDALGDASLDTEINYARDKNVPYKCEEASDVNVLRDNSVLSVRDLSNLETFENKTEFDELTLSVGKDRLGNPSTVFHVNRSKTPELENVSHHCEALLDLSKKLNDMKAANTDNAQDMYVEDVSCPTMPIVKHHTETEDNTLEIAREANDLHHFEIKDVSTLNKESKNEGVTTKDNMRVLNDGVDDNVSINERRKSSDLELLKILNENSEILNKIHSRRSSSVLLEDDLKPWKTLDKQRSLDIGHNKYENKNTKWFSSSVDFSSVKLESFSSKLSFETIDESKELKDSIDNEEVYSYNTTINDNQNLDRPKDVNFVPNEQTKFGIPNIAEEGEINQVLGVSGSLKSKSDGLGHRKYNKTFNPFPSKITTRQSKEIAIKLGLYSPNECNKNKKS